MSNNWNAIIGVNNMKNRYYVLFILMFWLPFHTSAQSMSQFLSSVKAGAIDTMITKTNVVNSNGNYYNIMHHDSKKLLIERAKFMLSANSYKEDNINSHRRSLVNIPGSANQTAELKSFVNKAIDNFNSVNPEIMPDNKALHIEIQKIK